ncbi:MULTISPECIES: hypothetical protein [unclassified Hyphomonas]|jgi:hypothetical protein|uniref:hypothetical protein n=1 Tax=unclassified Hyphomonas TaxID=2630699 RepID=UPI0004591713|nr:MULTISPECIES: hypothetical protein [unclassified Hyphomonas]KCZ49925.1 hypothetical protein HY17_02135 [Hyphomonas sp. CY54-11-8]
MKVRPAKSWLKRLGIGVVLAVLVIWAGYTALSNAFYHGRMPEHAGVGRILYKRVESFGFGPGGNETGLVIFRMNAHAVKRLQSDPDAFFQKVSESGSGRCHRFRSWTETPFVPEQRWGEASRSVEPGSPATIEEITNQYGFGIRFNARYVRMLNDSFARPGSYLGSGGCGSVVLMPEQRAAAYIIVG